MILHVFDYNYSSWSMRAGLVLRASGLPYRESPVPRSRDGELLVPNFSPSGLFPLLEIESIRVWDSLAIAETVAERAPQLWPKDPAQRAHARAISAEMHSGFTEIRHHMSHNIRARVSASDAHRFSSPAVAREWERIHTIWQECLAQSNGPFLFGSSFTIADAMYTPIVMRARTYAVELNRVCESYAQAIETHPYVVDWIQKAHAEELRNEKYEQLLTRNS